MPLKGSDFVTATECSGELVVNKFGGKKLMKSLEQIIHSLKKNLISLILRFSLKAIIFYNIMHIKKPCYKY